MRFLGYRFQTTRLWNANPHQQAFSCCMTEHVQYIHYCAVTLFRRFAHKRVFLLVSKLHLHPRSAVGNRVQSYALVVKSKEHTIQAHHLPHMLVARTHLPNISLELQASGSLIGACSSYYMRELSHRSTCKFSISKGSR